MVRAMRIFCESCWKAGRRMVSNFWGWADSEESFSCSSTWQSAVKEWVAKLRMMMVHRLSVDNDRLFFCVHRVWRRKIAHTPNLSDSLDKFSPTKLRQNRGIFFGQGPSHTSSVVVRHLPKDVTLPLAEHQSLQRGERILFKSWIFTDYIVQCAGELLYARFNVPASSGSLTAVVKAEIKILW